MTSVYPSLTTLWFLHKQVTRNTVKVASKAEMNDLQLAFEAGYAWMDQKEKTWPIDREIGSVRLLEI